MLHYHGVQTLDRALPAVVVTIGNFDGVHLGHRRILETARAAASARQGTLVAMTFRPHPRAALNPGAPPSLLTEYDEKIALLGALGSAAPDIVIEEPFSREFSSLGAEAFFKNLLVHRLSAQAVVVGYDFAFGKERAGDQATLKKLCEDAGVELIVVPPYRFESEVVSSSRIRQHLLAGECEAAARLLGRPFAYRGLVERGEGRGRKIGFPTANVSFAKLALPYGVYATRACWDGHALPSVTNVGVRPTFHDGASPLVETHVLDFQDDLYGRVFEIQFIRRIREERRFAGIDALRAQIALDIEAARQILGSAASA